MIRIDIETISCIYPRPFDSDYDPDSDSYSEMDLTTTC